MSLDDLRKSCKIFVPNVDKILKIYVNPHIPDLNILPLMTVDDNKRTSKILALSVNFT